MGMSMRDIINRRILNQMVKKSNPKRNGDSTIMMAETTLLHL